MHLELSTAIGCKKYVVLYVVVIFYNLRCQVHKGVLKSYCAVCSIHFTVQCAVYILLCSVQYTFYCAVCSIHFTV